MKNLWKSSDRSKRLYCGLILMAMALFPMGAKANKASIPEERLDTLSFIEMINSVDLGEYSDFIQKFQDKEAQSKLVTRFNKNKEGCMIEYYRNKEVILVTIPARLLFAPNETLLNENASSYLAPFKRYLKNPDTYRVLLMMHTDNTGSEEYREDITDERVESIFEWFEDQGCDVSFLFPYSMADDMPLVPNNTSKNRDINRRLEIYLMPGNKMLQQAKKGRIEF